MSAEAFPPVAPGASTSARLRELAIGLALLAGSTFSVTLAALQQAAPSLGAFIHRNQLELPKRLLMLNGSLGIMAAVTVGLLAWSLYKRLQPSAGILRLGKVICPLLIAAFLPALFTRGPWANLELEYLIVLGVVGLLLEQLLAVSLNELGPPRAFSLGDTPRAKLIGRWLERLPFMLVGAGVLYYAVLIGHYTLNTHIRMATATADLGEYDNQFFNSLHGHPFRLPASEGDLTDWSALKFHADFIIYVLLPFYAIKPGPQVLLIMQTVLIACTAIPIYLFGARRLPRWIAAIVALAFLLLPVIQRPNFYDFHAVPIGMFFAAWAIWGVDRVVHGERPRRRDYAVFWVAFALACLSREDIAFGMLIVSLFLVFYGKAPKLALAMLMSSALYFVLIKFVIMPRFGVSWYDNVYDDIKAAGLTRYAAVVATMFTNPVFVVRSMLSQAKLLYALHFLVPLLFLWVRRPYLWVAALPSVFFTLMVTNRPPMFQTSFQYAYQWFPYVVIASILALRHVGDVTPHGGVRQTAAALALALVASGADYQYGLLLGGKTIVGGFGEKCVEVSPSEWARYHELRALVAQIPAEASVAATEAEGPHVSTRLILYNIRHGLGDKPDYILFQRPIAGVLAARVRQALEFGSYGVLDWRGPFVLARRGHDTAKNAEVLTLLQHR